VQVDAEAVVPHNWHSPTRSASRRTTVPTYQYACTACGEQLEAVQSFSEASLTDCPACEGTLRKVFSAVGVVFKGSGFYRNDSRKGSGSGEKSSGNEKNGADKGGEKKKSETKTESSAPAAKTESAPSSGPKTAAASTSA